MKFGRQFTGRSGQHGPFSACVFVAPQIASRLSEPKSYGMFLRSSDSETAAPQKVSVACPCAQGAPQFWRATASDCRFWCRILFGSDALLFVALRTSSWEKALSSPFKYCNNIGCRSRRMCSMAEAFLRYDWNFSCCYKRRITKCD
jgi:hypothetical protein